MASIAMASTVLWKWNPPLLAYTQSRFHEIRIRLENHRPRNRLDGFLWEFFLFGFKQGWACLFGAILLSLLLLTKWHWPAHAWLARYDFLFLAALTVQILLLVLRMETVREAKVILMFHVVGTLMELFKTSVGSWTYPEHCFFHLGHVPLFSGFMYASVGSFLARSTRILDVRYSRYPKIGFTVVLAILIYANFFTHHYLPDIRIVLFALVAIAYGPTWVYFRPYRTFRRMPLLLGFGLVALFIWGAENVGTFAMVWVYPNQRNGWQLVHFGKFGAWLLLMIISFILVTFANPPRVPPSTESQAGQVEAERAEDSRLAPAK
jgi:uncharacterized membrane protein YoaT (DUF817 family)